MYPIAQKALDEFREATHKTFNENDITYINETPNAYKKFSILSKLLMFCLALSIVFCSISYITEKTLGPMEVKKVAKKQQSTQQPNRKVGEEKNERLWDTPARPITPTPDTAPSNTPAQPAHPAQQPAKPEQQPAQPAQPAQPEQQPSTEKK